MNNKDQPCYNYKCFKAHEAKYHRSNVTQDALIFSNSCNNPSSPLLLKYITICYNFSLLSIVFYSYLEILILKIQVSR